MIRSYTTYAGARRAARTKVGRDLPILRLLDDPQELFVVLPSINTRIMAVSGDGACDGSTTYEEIALND